MKQGKERARAHIHTWSRPTPSRSLSSASWRPPPPPPEPPATASRSVAGSAGGWRVKIESAVAAKAARRGSGIAGSDSSLTKACEVYSGVSLIINSEASQMKVAFFR